LDKPNATILIVEDDLDIAEMLESYFRDLGFTVLTANWGEDGIQACTANHPDLIMLDIRLPDVDGFEVARRIKANPRTQHIPMIFLTEKRERMDRMRGLELRAEDYITKPFDIQELGLRVRNALQRSKRSTLTNPVTSLPEGEWVDERLLASAAGKDDYVAVVSIANLDSFREAYGFLASDDLLRAVAIMLKDAVQELGQKDDFLGHLTLTEFVIISRSTRIGEVIDQLRQRLEQSFEYFYRHQDRGAHIFRGKGLAVAITKMPPGHKMPHDLAQIKRELIQSHQQGTD
jgi:PleD family two-component response regulator